MGGTQHDRAAAFAKTPDDPAILRVDLGRHLALVVDHGQGGPVRRDQHARRAVPAGDDRLDAVTLAERAQAAQHPVVEQRDVVVAIGDPARTDWRS